MKEKEKLPHGRPSKYKDEFCEMLIEHMESGLSYESFAGVISVARSTLYNFEENPRFLDSKKIAFEKSRLYWEKVGIQGMFMGGRDNPFNSTVWVFNMKNRFNWCDKVEARNDNKNTEIILNYNLDE